MKTQLTTLVLLLLGNYLPAQTKIDLQEAAKHVGETVTVTARVEGIRFYFRTAQRPVVFSLAAADAQKTSDVANLTLVVNNAEKTTYLNTGKDWYKKTVTITGTIVLNKGLPQIEITTPEQVRIVEKS